MHCQYQVILRSIIVLIPTVVVVVLLLLLSLMLSLSLLLLLLFCCCYTFPVVITDVVKNVAVNATSCYYCCSCYYSCCHSHACYNTDIVIFSTFVLFYIIVTIIDMIFSSHLGPLLKTILDVLPFDLSGDREIRGVAE